MVEPEKPHRVAGGRVARVAPLIGLAGRTAGEAVVASLRNRRLGERDGRADGVEFHTRNAQRYAERLGRSRGVLMKAGQILSVVMPDSLLDVEYRGIWQAALARLQDDVPPMPTEQVIDTITAELGRSPAQLFAAFDPHPLAAASIGQVHAATLRGGRQVAVKVQYPGVEQAIRADLKNTELLGTFLRLLFTMVPGMPRSDLRAVAREISDRIGEEVDYGVEAANQQEFADVYRGHPFIRIPEVLAELSTRRVLTMEFVDGLRYSKAVTAEQSLRDRWAEGIFRFAYGNLWKLGIINSDPHPGNYLFHPDGTVSFLDFGCVRRFSPHQVRSIVGGIYPILDQDPERLHQWMTETGYLDATDRLTHAELQELLGWWTDAYRHLLPPQPFTISSAYASAVMRNRFSSTGPHYRVACKQTAPSEHILAARMDAGSLGVLGGLGATGPWKAIFDEYARGAGPATAYGELDAAFRKAHR